MSKTDPTRIGVIGVGQIGKHHLRFYSEIPEAEVVAVADLDQEGATRAAADYGIDTVYSDFRDLLKRDDIEAVDVCLHNNLHATVTIAALEAGKHVFCEKPIAGSYRDGAAMVEAAERCNRRLSIQLVTLFSPETKAARRLVDAGRLGPIYHARSCGHRRRGRPYVDGYGTSNFVQKHIASGGALFDMGIYHIAQVLYLMGTPTVQRISGATYQETAMNEQRREASNYDVEELGLGLIHFEDGSTLDIIEAWAAHIDGFGSSLLLGKRGGLRLDPLTFFSTDAETDLDFNTGIDSKAVNDREHLLNSNASAFDSPQKHWVAALRGVVDLLPTADIALTTMLISEGIYLSQKHGREVTAEEVREQSPSLAIQL